MSPTYPNVRYDWSQEWRTIASMQNLQHLQVGFFVTYTQAIYDMVAKREREVMEGISAITTPKTFILYIPWRANPEYEDFWQELPCQIVRPVARRSYLD
jgi:hypothetical protein